MEWRECRKCGHQVPLVARRCANCAAPYPPHRHLRAGLAPIVWPLNWANTRRSVIGRTLGWIAAVVTLAYLSPLIVSWWVIVVFWWVIAGMDLGLKIAIGVGTPLALIGLSFVQASLDQDCNERWSQCFAMAVGLFGGSVTFGGVAGIVILAVGITVFIKGSNMAFKSDS